MRSLTALALTLALVAGACGDDPTTTTAPPDSIESGQPTTTDSSTTTTGSAPPTEEIAGPGLLELLDLTEGRVTLTPQGSGEAGLMPRGSADFHDGGLILHFDEHPDLDQAVADYRESLAERNQGAEPSFQVELSDDDPTILRAALVDLVAAIYLYDWMLYDPACRAELDLIRADFRATPPPEPIWRVQSGSTEGWDYPVETVPRLPPCVAESFEGVDPTETGLRIERNRTAGTLEVFFDPGYYSEPRHASVLLFVVTADAPLEGAPPAPSASIFDPTSMFLLAVNHCGELPWAYSNFMAANSYTGPDDGAYLEPSPFTSAYACADEVPDR